MNVMRARTLEELSVALDSGELDASEQARALREANTVQEANRLRRIYRLTGNGLLIWRIFSLYRRADLPIPEDVMRSFDRFAEELEEVSGPAAIARALRLTGKSGGAQGRAALDKSVRKLYTLNEVDFFLRTHPRASENEAFRYVARCKGMTEGAVKQMWLRYKSQLKRAGAGAGGSLDRAMRHWRRVR